MDEHDEQDRYVAQLQEVFNSCDPNGSGYLDRHGITLLCQQLQLDEQAPFFLQHLLKDKPHPLINFNDFKDEFISLLTQSIGQPELSQTVSSPEREISPKYVHGNKKYGRRSQPGSQELDSGGDAISSDGFDSEVFNSENSSFSASESVNNCPDMELMDHDGYTNSIFQRKNNKVFVKRKRRSNSDSKLYPSKVEENEPDYLRDIWKKLAVGADGFLDLLELERVCEHIGMEKMSQEMVHQLFAKLDTDHDGKISFEEFLNVFKNVESTVQSFTVTNLNSPKKITTVWSEKMPGGLKPSSAPGSEERCEATMLSSAESGIFSSLDPENQGVVHMEAIVDLWESLGFPNGRQILKDLGHGMSPNINLQDLSTNLEDVMISCDDSALRQLATATVNFELKHIRNSLDQLNTERNKLKGDVSEANSRANMLAQEIDDQNAKLEKSSQNKIIMLDKKYKDQIQSLMEEHQREKEQMAIKMSKLQQTKDEDTKHWHEEEIQLLSRLEAQQKENVRLDCEIRDLTEKLNENEKLNQRYQKDVESLLMLRQKLEEMESGESLQQSKYKSLLTEIESLKLENKKLRDCNDELVLKVESFQQQLVLRPPARTASSHKRNGSWLGEYVQNPATKRRGGNSNLLENSIDFNSQPGKICYKSLELTGEECGSEMDQFDFLEEMHDEHLQGFSFSPSEVFDTPVSAVCEMKNVFQFLKNKMLEEYVNECEENTLLNLKNLELRNQCLEQKLNAVQQQHEEEVVECQKTYQETFEREIGNWMKKWSDLQADLERQHLKEQRSEISQTDISYFCCSLNVEALNVNFYNFCDDKLLIEKDEQNVSSLSKENQLKLILIQLQLSLKREEKLRELCEAFASKCRESNGYTQLSAVNEPVTPAWAGGDALKNSDNYLLTKDDIEWLNDKRDYLSAYKIQHDDTCNLAILLTDLQSMQESNDLFNQKLLMSEKNYLFQKETCNKIKEELTCEIEVLKRKNSELESERRSQTEEISVLKADLQKCSLESVRPKEDDSECRLESDIFEGIQEKHFQEIAEIELMWQTQLESLGQQRNAELIQARAKIVQLETKLNEFLVAPPLKLDMEIASPNPAQLMHSEHEESKELVEESKRLMDSDLNLLKMDNNEQIKECSGRMTTLELDCGQLQKKKSDLEEDIAILEVEWATLQGANFGDNESSQLLESCATKDSLDVMSRTSAKESLSDADDATNLSPCEGKLKENSLDNLYQQLHHLEKKCRSWEDFSKTQIKKANRILKATKERHREEMEYMKALVTSTEATLKTQLEEYDNQLQKADILVKKLYLENAQLMKALQVTEERQKKAEQANAHLHDKCSALAQLVADIYNTAVA